MSIPDYSEPYIVGYTIGQQDGYAAGYAAREAEEAARWASWAPAWVDSAARGVPYATLADRRGEHDRAEQQRALLRERGIA